MNMNENLRSLVFASKSNVGDYHGEMNGNVFVKWVKEKFIPNLTRNSLIIMDNAPYHSMLKEFSGKKQIFFNRYKSITLLVNQAESKNKLLQIAKDNKKEKIYIVDELLKERGHDVLRLPPYHCEFNAIELIWAQAKGYYNKHIGRDGNSDENVVSMWCEALDHVTLENWKNWVRHTNDTIKRWKECDSENG